MSRKNQERSLDNKLYLRAGIVSLFLRLLLFTAISILLIFPGYKATTQQQGDQSVNADIANNHAPAVLKLLQRTRVNTDLPSKRYGLSFGPLTGSRRLPVPSVEELRPASSRQIGFIRPVSLDATAGGQIFTNADGSKIRLIAVQSPGAVELRVQLSNFDLAKGEEVYVYGLAGDSPVSGPYHETGPAQGGGAGKGAGKFWSDTIPGDTVIVEHYFRSESNTFTIAAVAHNYKAFSVPNLLDCHVDANCYYESRNDAVARIAFIDGGGSFVCSGTMLNDMAPNEFAPYFLTARHCVSTGAVASTVQALWFFRSTFCNSGVAAAGTPSPTGAALLNTETTSDQSLLRILNAVPTNLFYSGSHFGEQALNTSVFGLSHPAGSFLRHSSGWITNTNVACGATGLTSGYLADWTSGATEGSSSGSGLFLRGNGSYYGLLVGVNSCGQCIPQPGGSCAPFCGADAFYGKFSDFIGDISTYLGQGDYGVSPRPILNSSPNFMVSGALTTGSPASRVRGMGWFSDSAVFNGTAGQQIQLSLSSTAFDSYLYLLAPVQRRVVAFDDDSGNGTDSMITVTLPETGEYIALATTFFAGETGTYQLTGTVIGCNAPGAFTLSSPANGQIVNSTSSVNLSWQPSANSGFYDVYFGTSTNPPFFANQTGTSRSVNVVPGQTYFWKVVGRVNCDSSLTVTTGVRSFSVQSVGDPCRDSLPISIGQTLTGQLSSSGCHFGNGSFTNLYSFGATAGQEIFITLNSANFDAYLLLLDPDGTFIAIDDDGGGGTNSRIPSGSGLITLPITGTYTILVSSFGAGATGSYILTLGGVGLQFYPLAHPVRLLDTRPGQPGCDATGAMITGQTSRTQTAAGRTCDGLTIPANAKALTGNITTVQSGGGYLTLYPSDAFQPTVANSNYNPNQILNNVFTVGLGAGDGAFKIFVSSNTNVVVDITGYYAPPAAAGLYFHPLPKPIRLLETRQGQPGCLTTNSPLQANSFRTWTGRTTCDSVTIPAGAQALVGNATTVSPQTGGYLTFYPADAAQPLIASSNFLAGDVMNAPFTVGLSPSGQFKVFTTSTTDLVIDVLGYYSTQLNDVNGEGLLFNPLPFPIRLLDTRSGFTGCFTPGAPMIGGTVYTQPAARTCVNIPLAAKAVAGNATVVNANTGYLTFWPSNVTQPFVATSNFQTGQIFNRHFIVGLGVDDRAFKRFSSGTTNLVIDLSGYFAP